MSSSHDGSSCTGGKGKEDFTRVLVTAYLLSHPSQPPSVGLALELPFHLTFSRASAFHCFSRFFHGFLILYLAPLRSFFFWAPS